MIVDCHTHIWESPEQLGRCAPSRKSGPCCREVARLPKAGVADHLAASKPVDKTFVLAFKSYYLDADVPNDFVAAYVRQHADRLIGFAAVDPSVPAVALEDLRRAHDELGMRGVTIWPAAQDFHPACSGAMRVYAEACRLGMPVVFHLDVQASPQSKMEFARPYLIDEVAREFPDLRIIISQLGYPWTEEAVALLGKHTHVFTDISGLLHHQWHAYNALLLAHQAGVMDRLLFGSNFPYTSPAVCIEALYSINHICHGTNLPTVPREQLRRIVERNALELLGIEAASPPARREPSTTVIQVDD